ncbi:MAG: HlyD family efflux transporter periplasmic adaptor subunit [Gammaproteobacteria bacterium]|nr:HlyD family efflux transporter periplasmic adaptor subunit [Gammaproteobacteria bacterium]
MPRWIYRHKYLPYIILGAGILIGLLLLLIRSQPTKPQPKTSATIVRVQQIKPGWQTPQLALIGTVQSPRYTKLEAAVTAYVKATPVLAGETVKAGEVVIYLDDRDASNAYRQKQSVVHDRQAQLKAEIQRYKNDQQAYLHEFSIYNLTKKDVERFRTLTQKKLSAMTEFDAIVRKLRLQALVLNKRRLVIDNHKHRLAQLKARLEQAIAQRDQAKLDLERTKIIAPFNGRLVNLKVSIGDRVQPNDILAEIYDTDAIEVRAQLPNRYVNNLRTAIKKSAVISAHANIYNKDIALKLDRLGSEVRQGNAAIDAIFIPENRKIYLPIGLSIHLVVNLLPVANAIILPVGTVYNHNRIYKVVNNKLVAVEITYVGDRILANGQRQIIITSPHLKANDLILATHLPSAISGLKVKPIYEKPLY